MGGVADPGQHPDAVHGRLLVRLPLEGARVVDGVDVVLLVLVVHEGQPVRLARPRQDGRERGDALDAGVEVGELVDLSLAQVVQEDVAHAAAVGDEGDGPAVGRPLRAHVLALVHVVEDLYRPRRQIEQRDAEIAEGEGLEVGLRPAVGGERDGLPVRRPDGVEVPVLVGRQPPQVGAVPVDRVQVADPAVVAGEDQLLAVRAPGGRGDSAQLEPDTAHLLVPGDVHDDDLVARPSLGREREELAVGRPVGLRVDEPVGLVAAADAGLEDPPLHRAGCAVRQVQIDEVEVPLAEVGHLRAVRREGGGQVQRPLRPLLGQELVRHGLRLGPRADLGEVPLLHRVPPLVGELLQAQADRPAEGGLDPARQRGLEDGAHRLVAPALADVRPERVAEAVGEVLVRIGRHLHRCSAACPRATRRGATSPSRR